LVARTRRRRDLEEEIEAQEGQGVCAWQRASTLQTIRTDKASKVPVSQRAASVVSAMMPPIRIPQGRTPWGQGLRVTGVPRVGGRFLRGVVASRGSRLASAGPCETWRTPGSAAGCNKPASRSAEKAGEVVRYHEVGTGLPDWHPEAEGDGPRFVAGSRRATVLRKKVQSWRRGGWASRSGQPGRWSDPRRGGRCEPVRAVRKGSEGEPMSGSMIKLQRCWLVDDVMRKTSRVRHRPAQAESVVRPGRMRERPTTRYASLRGTSTVRAIFGSVPKPACW